MKEQVFNFLKKIISSRNVGDIITREELINMLIQLYKPSLKSPINATIRSCTNPVINDFIAAGFLERVGRGKYVLKCNTPILLNYKKFKKSLQSQ